eukprot:TRINITY_DN42352_c0_g1_i1.p1 TRINITY_DN42352_c0_g1~~TRINITY_DN42352_c0_g1_i1.p1  ORF type:complete len:492 (+),score=56.49 TRINITY_DN42352_c0_g1_i1:22-1476(+)
MVLEMDWEAPLLLQPAVVPKRGLNVWRLMAVMYMMVCCGAYATEEMVQSGAGPFVPLLLLLVLPFIWGLPVALGVAELATSIQSNAGTLMWVNVSFSPVATTAISLWTLMLNFTDTAIYPNLFCDYMRELTDYPADHWMWYLVKAGVIGVCTILNIVGVEIVGNFSTIFMVGLLIPFIIFFCWGIPSIEPSHWFDFGEWDWVALVPIVTWNLCGFDDAGHVAEEIDEYRSFPVAVVGCLVMTVLTYILPILVGTSINQSYEDWVAGYWVTLSGELAGSWLQYMMSVGGCLSALGLLLSFLCSRARALACMADMEVLPPRFGRWVSPLHPKFTTPVRSIIVNSLIALAFAWTLDFTELVEICAVLYAARLLGSLSAVIYLRFRHPTLHRPYRLPGGKKAIVAMMVFPISFCFLNIATGAASSTTTLLFGPGYLVATIVIAAIYVRVFGPSFKGAIVMEKDIDAEEGRDLGNATSVFMSQARRSAL